MVYTNTTKLKGKVIEDKAPLCWLYLLSITKLNHQ